MKTRIFLICTIAFLIGLTAIARSQDNPFSEQATSNWHQWRGPLATGESPEGNPPTTWSETENIRWKIKVPGEGSSTPIIWNDRVFALSAIETDEKPDTPPQQNESAMTRPPESIVEFVVWCFDRNTGQTIWKKVVNRSAPHEGRHDSTTYAASSPTTDGQHLFVNFGSYGTYCLDMEGTVVWGKDFGDMRTRRGWGEAVSPTLSENELVLMWDQEDQSQIFCLDKKTGNVIWKQDRDEPTTWATPLVVGKAKERQVVTAGTNHVRGYRVVDGVELWKAQGLTVNAIPSPVLFGNNVILMSGYRGNVAISIDLSKLPDLDGPVTPDWKLERDTPYVPSPLLTQGRLYFTKSLAATMTCIDARTGDVIIPTRRLPGLSGLYASPVATRDHIFISSREGTTLVIKNSPEFEVVATNRLDSALDASPAIVGEQILLRTKSHLYCIQTPESVAQAATSGATKMRQEESVRPGINTNYLDPDLDVDNYIERFEVESREIFASRLEVLRETGIKDGSAVADIGAGTGLFTRLFARTVGRKGRVYAVDISAKFLEHIRQDTDEMGLLNVTPVLCAEDSTSLPKDSIDVAFVCDTYHHFEYPKSTLASIHEALRADGQLIVIDFERIPGQSREFVLGHVRAGKDVFRGEIEAAGFSLKEEIKIPGFKENYFLRFTKSE